MARDIKVAVVFPSMTGIPADSVVNDFHFHMGADSDEAAIVTAIDDFYNNDTGSGGTFALARYLNGTLSRASTAVQLKFYEMPATPGPIGSPFNVANMTLGPTSGNQALPSQVAAAVAFHGDLAGVPVEGAIDPAIPTDEAAIDEGAPATHAGVTRPAQRRKNRVFLGPLNVDTIVAGDGHLTPVTWATVFRNDVKAAAGFLLDLITGTSGSSFLGVWSGRDWAMRQATGGWITDRPDTQRRRLEKVSSRRIF